MTMSTAKFIADPLERRREINRRAAKKSRSRQKEIANQIRKKYYDAQSINTKLVYDRKQLSREREKLLAEYSDHRSRCPKISNADFDPRDLETMKSMKSFQQRTSAIPSSLPKLPRSFSWPRAATPTTPTANAWVSDVNDADEHSTGSDSSYEDEAASMSSSFTGMELAEADLGVDPIELQSTDDLSSVLRTPPHPTPLSFADDFDNFPADLSDSFLPFEELSSSALLSGSALFNPEAIQMPVASEPEPIVHDLIFRNRQSCSTSAGIGPGFDSDVVAPSLVYEVEEPQSEAIDLSKGRATAADHGENLIRTAIWQRTVETCAPFAGNIPLHVQDFIAGEK